MINEFDYDEEIMKQCITPIHVPQLATPTVTSRIRTSEQEEVFLDLQRLIQQERMREEKRIQGFKQKQHQIGQNVSKRLAQKDRKIRELEEEQKRRTFAECTFKPKTTTKKGTSRSLQQFLQQQDDFTKKIQQKRETLKQTLDAQKESKSTFQPKTNGRNQRNSKKEGNVFDRLYALKDKENQDQGNSQEMDSFQPRIHQKSKKLTRNAPINQLLYQDALRRQERAKDIESRNHTAPIQERQTNLNNQRYVAQKFIKQYYGVIEKLDVPSSTQASIDYMLFNEILKEMGFVQVQEEGQSSQERTLIHEAYQLLENFQVNAKNICVFLLALIGVFHINPVNFQEGEEQNQEQELAFDEVQGRKVQRSFDLFKRNRLFSQNSRKQIVQVEPGYSFKPQTNKNSDKMAEIYREQMLQQVNEMLEMFPEVDFNIPKDGVISPTDLLVLYNKAKELKMECRKQQQKEMQLQNCTFKPTTLEQSKAMMNSKFSIGEGSLGQKKSLQLYNYHKQLASRKESLRVSRQSQDSTMKECTFAPNINRSKVQEDKSKYSTKEVEQALFRMRKGREQYENKKKFLERGQLKSSVKREFHSNSIQQAEEQQQNPILLLDVNLGNKVQRLTLNSGDEDRLQEVAKQFAEKHELDEESESKLVELLRLEVENLLEKIPEDEESEDKQ